MRIELGNLYFSGKVSLSDTSNRDYMGYIYVLLHVSNDLKCGFHGIGLEIETDIQYLGVTETIASKPLPLHFQ